MLNFINSYGSIFISLISALIAFSSYRLSKPKINFIKFDNEYRFLEMNQLTAISKEKETYGLPVYIFPSGILIHLNVLNSSPQDVAYFNVLFSSEGKVLEAYTMKSISYIPHSMKIILSKEDKQGEIPLIEKPHGKFLANSDTPIYTFLRLDNIFQKASLPNDLTFQIQYAIRTWRHPFKPYSIKEIHIPVNDLRKWKAQEQLLNRQLTPQMQFDLTSNTPLIILF